MEEFGLVVASSSAEKLAFVLAEKLVLVANAAPVVAMSLAGSLVCVLDWELVVISYRAPPSWGVLTPHLTEVLVERRGWAPTGTGVEEGASWRSVGAACQEGSSFEAHPTLVVLLAGVSLR